MTGATINLKILWLIIGLGRFVGCGIGRLDASKGRPLPVRAERVAIIRHDFPKIVSRSLVVAVFSTTNGSKKNAASPKKVGAKEHPPFIDR
jgi:hypothetical protein